MRCWRFATKPSALSALCVRTWISLALCKTALSTPEQRNSLARNVFAQAHPVLIDVLAVMAERGDFALLSRVWESYGEQVERKLNVTVVDVTTVVPLDDHCARLLRRNPKRLGHQGRIA